MRGWTRPARAAPGFQPARCLVPPSGGRVRPERWRSCGLGEEAPLRFPLYRARVRVPDLQESGAKSGRALGQLKRAISLVGMGLSGLDWVCPRRLCRVEDPAWGVGLRSPMSLVWSPAGAVCRLLRTFMAGGHERELLTFQSGGRLNGLQAATEASYLVAAPLLNCLYKVTPLLGVPMAH